MTVHDRCGWRKGRSEGWNSYVDLAGGSTLQTFFKAQEEKKYKLN